MTQTTAWKVQQKLAQVMLDREAAKPVGGPDKRVEMDDAYLGGARRGGKRGRGAAGKKHPRVVVETTIEGHLLRLKLNAVKGFRKVEIKKLSLLSLRTLVPGTTVISDALGCFGAVTQGAAATSHTIVTGSGAGAVQIFPPSSGSTRRSAISETPSEAPIMPSGPSTLHVTWPSTSIASTAAPSGRHDFPPPRLGRIATPPMPYRLLKLAELSA